MNSLTPKLDKIIFKNPELTDQSATVSCDTVIALTGDNSFPPGFFDVILTGIDYSICRQDGGGSPNCFTGTIPGVVEGTILDDSMLIGTSNADRIDGKDGNDVIDGKDGKDRIIGGNGDDTIIYDVSYLEETRFEDM